MSEKYLKTVTSDSVCHGIQRQRCIPSGIKKHRPSWESNSYSFKQENVCLSEERNVQHCVHKSPPSVPALIQMDPVHTQSLLILTSILILFSHTRYSVSSLQAFSTRIMYVRNEKSITTDTLLVQQQATTDIAVSITSLHESSEQAQKAAVTDVRSSWP